MIDDRVDSQHPVSLMEYWGHSSPLSRDLFFLTPSPLRCSWGTRQVSSLCPCGGSDPQADLLSIPALGQGQYGDPNYTKKSLNDLDNHDSVVTHLESDILAYEAKQALGSITTNKASGCDGIPAELFKILKDGAVKVLHSICQQIWKTQQWPQDWKMSVFIPIPKKGSAKNCSNYQTIALISHTSKIILKILQVRLQQNVTENIQMYKLGLEKAEEPEIELPTFAESQRKQENSRKTSTSASLTTLKPLTVWITTNCGKFLKRWEYQTTVPVS